MFFIEFCSKRQAEVEAEFNGTLMYYSLVHYFGLKKYLIKGEPCGQIQI